MPYSIKKDASACGVSKPYAVVDPSGKVHGCHETRDKARAHQRALYVNTEEAMSPEDWEGLMAELVEEEDGYEVARHVSTEERKKLAGQGKAMPDGSYPIETEADLKNAIQAFGRANEAKRPKLKAHIKKRAAALGLTNLIPEGW